MKSACRTWEEVKTMQPLTMVAPAPGETPEPGWPDESWREYAEHSLTHDDLPREPIG